MKYSPTRFGKPFMVLLVILIIVAAAACTSSPASPTTTTATSPPTSSISSPIAISSMPPASSRAPSPSLTASPTTSPSTTTSPGSFTVNIMNKAPMGNYLVNANGLALYYNANDAVGASNVPSSELQVWPIFYTANVVVPSSLKVSDFGTLTRSDGQKQTTYKGWPLYLYTNDKASGDANGNGLSGVWFVVNPDRFPPQVSVAPSPSPAAAATSVVSPTASGASPSPTRSGY